MKLLFVVLFSWLCLSTASAQSRALEKADDFFEREFYPQAIRQYTRLVKTHANDYHVLSRLGDSYRMINDFRNAEQWYARAVRHDEADPQVFLYYAEVLKYNNKHEKALEWMARYKASNRDDVRALRHAEVGNYAHLLNPMDTRVELKYLEMNGDYSEFGGVFTGSGRLVFASTRHGARGEGRRNLRDETPFYRLYQAQIGEEGELHHIREYAPELHAGIHTGPVSFSADGKEIFFTRNEYVDRPQEEGRVNRLMIYQAYFDGQRWTDITLLPFNSKEYSCGHPSLSADGRRLYFVSDMPGGYGNTDIYMVERVRNRWGEPVNLGPQINTPGREMFPFVHGNGNLYFSSDGYAGLGGLDIYMAPFRGDTLGTPRSLGAPLNSSADDFGFVLMADGSSGYITSNRRNSQIDDIYHFKFLPRAPVAQTDYLETYRDVAGAVVFPLENDIPGDGPVLRIDQFSRLTPRGGRVELNAQAQSLTYYPPRGFWGQDTINYTVCDTLDFGRGCSQGMVVVNVLDVYQYLDIVVVQKGTQEPLPGVNVTLLDDNNRALLERISDQNGQLRMELLKDRKYALVLRLEDYVVQTVFSDQILIDKNNSIRLEMQAMEGLTFTVGVSFDAGSAAIKPEAAKILEEQVLLFLLDNPGVIIEIGAHTDSRGDARNNQLLSQRRADAVRGFLLNKGATAGRMIARGYGSEKLLNRCAPGVSCSEEEHRHNQRVEIRVVWY